MAANMALFWAEDEGMLVDRAYLETAIGEAEAIIQELDDKMMNMRKVKNFILREREIVNTTAIEKLNAEIKKLEEGKQTAGTARSIKNRKDKIKKLKIGELDCYEGLNLASPAQLGRLLYETHGFGFKMPYDRKKRKPAPSTAKDALEELNDKSGFVENLLLLRSIQKILQHQSHHIYKDFLDSLATTIQQGNYPAKNWFSFSLLIFHI
jgi:DNA polymerase I-like protein with 3'-5' exonuclease and polymerase domains